jgi:hypothetical protein
MAGDMDMEKMREHRWPKTWWLVGIHKGSGGKRWE